MLFPYKFVPHKMEMMQEFIDFLFYEVWCKASVLVYGADIFEKEGKPWKKIMEELFRLDSAGKMKDVGAAAFFYNDVNQIFNEFKALTADEIESYKTIYAINNSIEDVCKKTCSQPPSKYPDLLTSKAQLNELLKDFFSKLYSSGFFDLKLVKDAFESTLSKYYTDFVRSNNEDICPFCGLQPLDGEFDPTREAFDHYLPKSLYPFNSVNLKNLAPSCNKCNSGNKKDKDIAFNTDGTTRKAFYPFSTEKYTTNIHISITDKKWYQMTPECLNLRLSSDGHEEEVNTWIDLFRIDQRFAAHCCGKRGELNWLNRIFAESSNYQKTPKEVLESELKYLSADMLSDANFLKKPFLEACEQAGLFNEDQLPPSMAPAEKTGKFEDSVPAAGVLR